MPKNNANSSAYICCQCNRGFSSPVHFYKTYSSIYAGKGYLPICKDCFEQLYIKYRFKYNSSRKAMQRLCMAFDLYYSDSILETCTKDDDNVDLGNYIKRLNMVQYQRKTFDSSLDEGFEFTDVAIKKPKQAEQKDSVQGQKQEKPEEINQKDIDKWGFGFDSVDYGILNSHYKFLKTANPNCDSNQEIFINDLCYTKMQQLKAVREGRVDDYSKLTESYRKSFQQAGLKTIKDETTSEGDSWSSWTYIVSQYTPEEYYKNKELYKDMDGFGDYYNRHAIRPLMNTINGTNERDSEFYIHEGEADDYEQV